MTSFWELWNLNIQVKAAGLSSHRLSFINWRICVLIPSTWNNLDELNPLITFQIRRARPSLGFQHYWEDLLQGLSAMVLLKMKFTQQRRVRLAQGLWLLSWLAVMCGTFIFCLGVYLKTELLRRAEVERTTNSHLHVEGGKTVMLTMLMQTQFHVLESDTYSAIAML